MKVLGIYKAQLHPVQSDVFYMVMEKLGKGLQPANPVGKFDLKGSNNKAKASASTKRDRDLREMIRSNKIEFNLTSKNQFSEKLVADCSMLEELGLMDYSLLLFVLRPEVHSVNKLHALLQNYNEQIQILGTTMEQEFGSTRAVNSVVSRLDNAVKFVDEHREKLMSIPTSRAALTRRQSAGPYVVDESSKNLLKEVQTAKFFFSTPLALSLSHSLNCNSLVTTKDDTDEKLSSV